MGYLGSLAPWNPGDIPWMAQGAIARAYALWGIPLDAIWPPRLGPRFGVSRGVHFGPQIGRFRVSDLDLNVIYSGFGGPDPQIDGFGPLLGSKSGGSWLAGSSKSLATVV